MIGLFVPIKQGHCWLIWSGIDRLM